MTREQVEHVARAFYEVEFSLPWNEAGEATQNRFRGLARTAIARLDQQIVQYRRSVAQPAA
ncbi:MULTISPECIES: hypothetical protein [Microvirga]|uniref:hypothetical protein n=1 Tax=Microvirga TaxID=186650 RepID=UPI001B385D43|nr:MULTISPECIES: hypothetical protein [unclassified Microvirga]MBQ0820042.1 hypothetical protein [Microvirga sp. HBU67558]